jgi:uncharacterized DUF497 family protein
MARKSKAVSDELKKAQEKAKQIEQLLELAETEEKNQLEKAEKAIGEIAEKNNLFCGVILTKKDVVSIISLALDSGENIRIPFKLYFNE